MAGQVYHWAPAPRGGDRIAFEMLNGTGHRRGSRIDGRDLGAADSLGALYIDDRRTLNNGDASRPRCSTDLGARFTARIDNGDHLATRIVPIESGLIRAIIGGHHHQLLTRHHCVATDVVRHR